MTKGADIKKRKLDQVRARKRKAALTRATKASPPVEGAEFMALVGDLGAANVGKMSGVVSLSPRIGICALPLNLIPYRGCSNACAYCFVNQMARGNIARKPGVRDRKFYAAADSLDRLIKFLQVSRGQCRLEDLPKGQQLHGWFFRQRIPARLSALTDPFMRLEKTRRKSYEMLNLCKAYAYPVVINTKGGDIFDSYLELIASLPHRIVQVSLLSVDEEVVREYEPNSPPVAQRLAAIKKLLTWGVYVSVRLAPLIPDVRITGQEHLERYARALSAVGVTHVNVGPLRVQRGVQMNTENPTMQRVMKTLDTSVLGNNLSIPVAQLQVIGRRLRDIFASHNIRYGSSTLEGFEPFGEDALSACHCANLEEVGPPFDNYYKATFPQLALEARRVWEREHLPVLIQRSDLDHYPYPADKYIFPARSKADRRPYSALLEDWWMDATRAWHPPYFWEMGYVDADQPELDYDSLYGLITYFYDPHAPLCDSQETLEQHRKSYAGRACVLLNGKQVPFPEDEPQHPFWQERREAYIAFQAGTAYRGESERR